MWITGDAGEVCSEEVLKSQNKSFVPQFTDRNLNKEQPSKVMYIYLVVVGGRRVT